jgi:hypothetical protein
VLHLATLEDIEATAECRSATCNATAEPEVGERLHRALAENLGQALAALEALSRCVLSCEVYKVLACATEQARGRALWEAKWATAAL